MRARTVFLWITPCLLGAFLIGLLTARAVEEPRDRTFWSDSITERVREIVGTEYVDAVPEKRQKALFYAAMQAYMNGLDEYCRFFDPEECRQMEVDTRGEFGGIGVLVRPEKDGLVVTGLRRSDPADRAGMKIGDRIVTVGGKPVAGLTLDDVTALIKGPPETSVSLDAIRDGKTLSFTMARSEVKVDSVKGVKVIDPSHGIGYLHVAMFQENTGEDAATALMWLKRNGATSIILDLRQNHGGVLEKGAVALANLFLERGVIVRTEGRIPDSCHVYEASKETTVCPDDPLVVLVDGGSASAAEVVAGAFQDHRRGILVGQRTYGKFLVQSIHRLPEFDTALSLTTARYYTPYGRWLQRDRKGVRGGLLPDVVVERKKEDDQALAQRFAEDHGLDMIVKDSPESSPAAVDDQLERAVEILADFSTVQGKDR